MPAEIFHVTGPPGTGKTTYLSRQATLAAEAHGGERVIVCSLTKAAATEAAGRNIPIPDRNIGTLHALAYRTLGKPRIAEAHTDEWNKSEPAFQVSVGKKTTADTQYMDEKQSDLHGDKMLARMNLMRSKCIDETMWPKDLAEFAKRWRGWCDDSGLMDFTAMIEECADNTDSAPGEPEIILADEAQDYSRLEHRLLMQWGNSAGKFILCADPDQAIYEWRGADPRLFLDHPVPEDHRRVLSQSYRVPRTVHAFAMRWIQQVEDRDDVAYEPCDAEGSVEASDAKFKSADDILPLCREHADGDSGTLMILASCDYMLKGIITLLRIKGIPFHNPYRRTNGRWNPLQRRRNTTSNIDRLVSFVKPGVPESNEVLHMLGKWSLVDMRDWLKDLSSKEVLSYGAKKDLETLIELWKKGRFGHADNLANFKEGDVFFRQLFRDTGHADRALQRDLPWFLNSLLASKKVSYKFPARVLQRRGPDALTDEPKIIVGTIHSVKGGEADTVVMFPDLSPQGARAWSDKSKAGCEKRNAIIRVFYVGATRSKNRLILCKPSSRYAAVEWGI